MRHNEERGTAIAIRPGDPPDSVTKQRRQGWEEVRNGLSFNYWDYDGWNKSAQYAYEEARMQAAQVKAWCEANSHPMPVWPSYEAMPQPVAQIVVYLMREIGDPRAPTRVSLK